MLRLYHNDMSVCAQKVRMVLAHKGVDYENVHFNLRAREHLNPDFLKLSPKGLVPVLVHDDEVVLESNAIIEYLEEVFPQVPLLPEDPVQRARIRAWLIRLDAGLHEQVAVISFCVAFRHQLLERYRTDEELQGFLASIPDPHRKAVLEDTLVNGMDSPRLGLAVYAFDKLLADMERALEPQGWLVADQMSLADLSFVPYIERLEQLQLGQWWADKPNLSRWLERVRGTQAYAKGTGDWLNPGYLGLMREMGEKQSSAVFDILQTFKT